MSVASPVPPPPGSPQPPKKGLSPLAWVGIGCAVLIVLGLIVLAGVTFFVKSKVDDFKAHPAFTSAKLMVTLNPDLELVSSDEKTDSLTIKDKKSGDMLTISADEKTKTLTVKNEKTGETSTMSADDAKNGNFRFKSDKGTATIDTSGPGGATIKTTNEKGETTTMNAGVGAPQNLPSWLPVYPGGKVQGTFDATTAEGHTASFAVSTTDSLAKMMEFYESQLKSAGFKIEKMNFSGNGQDGGTVTAKSSDDKRQAIIIFGSTNGVSSATVTSTEKK
jgi:hypothetical protein